MKKQLLFLLFYVFAFAALQAQTITWTGAVDVNYSNPNNWNPAQVPTATNDVVIPTGSTMTINVAASVKSIKVQGTSTITIANQLSFTNASSFSSNSTITFSSGNLRGGGTLTNNGTIDFTTTNVKYIFDNTFLKNNGTINIIGTGQLRIEDGTINNETTGIIDFQTEGSSITYYGGSLHQLNNYGLIKRTSIGNADIFAVLHNDGGTFSILMGELILSNGSNILTSGTYNVSTGAALTWGNTITCEGTLTGNLNGPINWNGYVSVIVEATFDFSGATGIKWNSGGLRNGGTLINKDKINLLTNSIKYILNDANLNNEGTINISSNASLRIEDGTLNNQSSGIIDFRLDGANITYYGGNTHIVNNYGLIKQSSEGTGTISTILNNNDGTISVEDGVLVLNSQPKYLNDGTFNVVMGSSMEWNSQVVPSGILSGTLNGPIAWNDQIYAPVDTSATFNFSGSAGIHWNDGNLAGGGTLINQSEITFLSTEVRQIYDNTSLNNEGYFSLEGAGQLRIEDGIFNNQSTGVIEFKTDGALINYYGGSTHILNNAGVIKQATAGNAYIDALLNNSGTISIETGTMNFRYLTKYLNNGIYKVANGASLKWDTQIILSGVLTGALNGDISWNNEVNVPTATSATFNFTGNMGVNWNSGNLRGGGTLISQSEISMLSTEVKQLLDNTILNNEGDFNLEGSSQFRIEDGIFNNRSTGVIDFRADGAAINYYGGSSHVLNNYGLIKQTAAGNGYIDALLNNNNGTISIEAGILNFRNQNKYLNGGIYNVSSGASFKWNTSIVISGTLTGILDGDISWNNSLNVPVDTIAKFNFTGSTGVNWNDGNLAGGGTLVNQSEITLLTTQVRQINDNTSLNNENEFNIEDTGQLRVENGIFNNQFSGVIDFKVDGASITYYGGNNHVLNNLGLIKKSAGSGTSSIATTSNTNSGIIDTQFGILAFNNNLNNTEEGIIKGVAALSLPAASNFTNDGTFSPGGSPGILTVLGTYISTPTSVLAVEINGLNAGTEYDQLVITGTNAVFEGTVNVELGFEANVGDSFMIATVSGAIATENLVSPVYSVGGCREYTFAITYPGNNSVVLTVTNKGEVQPPEVNTQDITVQLDENGNVTITPEQIDNGSAAGCTEGGELSFSLDRTQFSCADLGDNTVILTVTDENENSASGTAVVTVEDTRQPIVTVQDISVDLDASGSVTISAEDIDNGSLDNCSITSISLDNDTFSCSNIGTNTITLTAEDQSGNISTANATVTVFDPLNACIESPVNDNCVNAISFEIGEAGVVGDNTNATPDGPVMDCAFIDDPVQADVWFSFVAPENGNLTIQTSKIDGSNMGDSQMQILDACGGNVLGCSEDEGIGLFSLIELPCGQYTSGYTYYVQVDAYGLYNNGPFKLTVTVDGACGSCEPPELSVYPSDSTGAPTDCLNTGDQYYVNVGVSGGSGNNSYTLTDNNGIELTDNLTSNYIAGPYDPDVTVSFMVVGNDNNSCSTVSDMVSAPEPCDQTPNAVCQSVTVSTDGNCQGQAEALEFDGGSTDPQGLPLTYMVNPEGPYNMGTTDVTLTVSNGTNSDSCTTTITVVDDTPPVANCAAPFTVQLDESGIASIDINDIDNGSTDNCGIASMAIDKDLFDCSEIGENTVTLSVADPSGNISTCTTVVTVEDSLAPTVLVQDITVNLDSSGNVNIFTSDIDNGSYDNCSIATMELDLDSFTCSDIGENTVTLTVTDINGNAGSATATVTVEDPMYSCGTVDPDDYFITTWKTTTSNESITIPTYPGEIYNYSVNWGDGNTFSGYTGNATHIYSDAGTYTVSISGNFARIYFNNVATDRMKIQSIEQWGTQAWTSMNGAFAGAGNLVSNATDMPDLSLVTDMYGMFAYARKFNGDSAMGNWNVASVTNMYGMFAGTSVFNAEIKGWNVGNVTTMENMFYGATLFNRNLSDWNVSNVTNMKFMFATAMKFNGIITNWDVSNVTDMNSMFYHANSFDQNLGNWNVSNVTNMNNMFKNVILSTANYDSILMGWSMLPLKNNVRFNAGFSEYCAGEAARRYIVDSYNWNITDGGMECTEAFQKPDSGSQASLSGVILYPNPMKDRLNVGNPKNVQLEKIEIFDLTGRLLKSTSLEGMESKAEVDVSLLSSATYVVVVTGNNEKLTQFFIKE